MIALTKMQKLYIPPLLVICVALVYGFCFIPDFPHKFITDGVPYILTSTLKLMVICLGVLGMFIADYLWGARDLEIRGYAEEAETMRKDLKKLFQGDSS